MQKIHSPIQTLDSRQLLAFATLAKTCNFTTAGQELFLSQSAVSHSLKVLESDLGCRLVDRLGKKIQLTPAGEHLLYHAQKILGDMTLARESLDRLAKWGKGRLRIAAAESVRQHLLPDVLLRFQKDFADWPVSVQAADTHQAVELIRQRSIELAIVIAPSEAEAVGTIPLFADELVWLVSMDHPWAKGGGVVRAEIPAQRFILTSAASYTTRLLEKYLQRDGIQPKLFLELGNLEAVKETVRRGLGVAVLPPWVARKELEEKSLVAFPLGKRKLRRNWCVIHSLEKQFDLAATTFVKLCHESTQPMNFRL